MILLETKDLCKHFGGLKAVNNVNMQVEQGQIYGLIGPNGAGKTTFLDSISGVQQPTSGKVFFDGKDVTTAKSFDMCHRGMARTFQIVRSFQDMTVLENVIVGGIFLSDMKTWQLLVGGVCLSIMVFFLVSMYHRHHKDRIMTNIYNKVATNWQGGGVVIR